MIRELTIGHILSELKLHGGDPEKTVVYLDDEPVDDSDDTYWLTREDGTFRVLLYSDGFDDGE